MPQTLDCLLPATLPVASQGSLDRPELSLTSGRLTICMYYMLTGLLHWNMSITPGYSLESMH